MEWAGEIIGWIASTATWLIALGPTVWVSAFFSALSVAAAFLAVRRANRVARANIRVTYAPVSDGTFAFQVRNIGPAPTLEFSAAIDNDKGWTFPESITDAPLAAGDQWAIKLVDPTESKRFIWDLRWTDIEGRSKHHVYRFRSGNRKANGRNVGASNLYSRTHRLRVVPRSRVAVRFRPAWVALLPTYWRTWRENAKQKSLR